MPGLKGYNKVFTTAVPGLPDGWLARVKPDGSGLDYATYIGGGGANAVTGVATDNHGNAYVNLFTGSNPRPRGPTNPFGGFPVTPGAFNPTYNGTPAPLPQEGAAAKINTNVDGPASLVYLTYIGGAGSTQPFGNKVDAGGNVYITGQTTADQSTFPSGHGFGGIPGFDHRLNAGRNTGKQDAFVVKLNPSGSALDYATYIGGSGAEVPIGIGIDSAGSAFIAGTTSSSDGTFPAVNGPSSRYHGGPNDAFVAKLNRAGTALDYAGFIGGTGDDQGLGMAVDSAGNAYIAGSTDSSQTSFPVKLGPSLIKRGPFGTTDAFVAKIKEVGPFVARYGMTNRVLTTRKLGTTFKYTLSDPARVRIVIAQAVAGRRRGGRCVAPTSGLRNARRCTRFLVRGTLTWISQAGANRVAFSGRFGATALKPGTYAATLQAIDMANYTSIPHTIFFTVVNR
jgi:hypothetical protein